MVIFRSGHGSPPRRLQGFVRRENYELEMDFGDGETSTEQNPMHIYKQAGRQYVVTLW